MQYFSRADWGAQPSKYAPQPWGAGQPSSWTLHYEGGDTNVSADDSYWLSMIRAIQNYHLWYATDNYADIAYNFVVAPNGFVFEGVGWDVRSQAQVQGNPLSIAVCYMGGPNTPLTNAAKVAFWWLFNQRPDLTERHPHSYWVSTQCCGDIMREWIAAGCPSPVPEPTPEPEEEDMRFPYSVVRVIEDARVFQVGQGRVYLPSEDSIRLLVDLGLVEPGDGPGGAKVLDRPKVYVEQLPEVA